VSGAGAAVSTACGSSARAQAFIALPVLVCPFVVLRDLPG
jgi:hypothetical protein